MSFATDLRYLMSNDASLTSYCTGGIHYENLPENFEIFKNWIVYSFNKAIQQNCMEGTKAFTEYAIIVKAVAKDTIELETICDRAVNYLQGNSYNGIQDVYFVSDSHGVDLDKNIYMNTLTFGAIYV